MKHVLSAWVAVLAVALGGAVADAQEAIKALLVTGHNNHNWPYTSRVHAETLEGSGLFDVTITDDPAKTLAAMKPGAFKVFVLDYNDFHEPKRWGEAAEKRFLEEVSNGAGVVAVHSANNAFKGWDQYERMLGLMWREGTGHGSFHAFSVEPIAADHPITAGLAKFETGDELYHKLVNSQSTKYRLLASAMSSKESGGTGEREPMAFTLEFGKGRVFATPLGHVWNGSDNQKTSVTNPGFRSLLCRGAEWAATGAVTQPVDWKGGHGDERVNSLSEAEVRAGWTLLFDGEGTEHWRGYKKPQWPKEGWVVENGAIKHVGGKGGGDIVTVEQYDDFDMVLQWRVAKGGNSGVIYRVTEDKNFPWETGPEMQILDDANHPDGRKPKTRAGTLYDIVPAAVDVSRPAGEWNHARLTVVGTKVQHWLNGFKVVDIDTASDDYKKAHAASKWPGMKDYNTRRKGHIALQDHGDPVEFRGIKIRRAGDQNPRTPTAESRRVKEGGLTHGPFPGHCTASEVSVWARGATPGLYRLWLVDSAGALVARAEAKAEESNDLCMTFNVKGLAAGVRLTARVAAAVNAGTPDMPLPGSGECTVATVAAGPATIVFGSCINEYVDRAMPVWEQVAKVKPDAVCLIGDTPYIDTTDLAVQRARYGNFFAVPEMAALRKSGTIFYGVWDDHDFGLNDTDGRLPGKENSRQAFLEYHANAGGTSGAGDGAEGVYSSFRRGPVEVFLIDARWFSNRDSKSLLGERQWQWLQDGLKRSAAPFKLLATGMVWNDNVRVAKTDYWGNYPLERKRLFDYLASEKIGGVVLVSGDIHRCRVFRNHAFDPIDPDRRRDPGMPYTIHEWVSSPLGNSVHELWNVPGSNLVWDVGETRAFLSVTVEADGSAITGRWINGSGREMLRQRLTAVELTPGPVGTCPPTTAAISASRGQSWEARHTDLLKQFGTTSGGVPAGRVVFLGDSITEAWPTGGKETWDARFTPMGALAMGIGGDRTQHVLWRLDHGLSASMQAAGTKLVVLMIGTNNSNGGDHSAAEIAEGVAAITRTITASCDAKVLVLGVFPRGEKPGFQRRKVEDTNRLIAGLDGRNTASVRFADLSGVFLCKEGWAGELSAELMPDYLHLSPKGYALWGEAVEPIIQQMLAK